TARSAAGSRKRCARAPPPNPPREWAKAELRPVKNTQRGARQSGRAPPLSSVSLIPSSVCAENKRPASAGLLRASIDKALLRFWFNAIESDSSLIFLIEHDLIRKPVPTFRDHALKKTGQCAGRSKEED